MTVEFFLLIIVVITALAFDFTNGFHDTGNAIATAVASGALGPKVAVTLCASLNLLGAFLSTQVAATIAKDLVVTHLVTLEIMFAGLIGGIVWNLLTWLFGIPSSSSHALIGGVVGERRRRFSEAAAVGEQVCCRDRQGVFVVEDAGGECFADAAQNASEAAARHDGHIDHLACWVDDLFAAEQGEGVGADRGVVLAVDDRGSSEDVDVQVDG